jgi:signal transduction histidine kinase
VIEKINYRAASLNFDVDAQLIRELGERLVSRNHIGISELIKNAYDADSPLVEVILSNVNNPYGEESELTIIDSGNGMDFQTVSQRWMTIGTSNKRENPYSPVFGRPVTGNKGIGRFACQRLAKQLELETCAKTAAGYEYTSVHFEWDDFIPGQPLSKVQCKYEYFSSPTGKTGTTLKLKGLRDRVSERDFKMLLKSISLISIAQQIKRTGYKEDPGFKATITAPEFKHFTGDNQFSADEKLLSAGWGTLRGEVFEHGKVTFSLDSTGTETQTYEVSDKSFLPLQGTKFTIYIIPLKGRDGIENRRSPTLLTSSTLKDIQEIYSGIKLYLNRFRVYPYGDVAEGDDWLGITRDLARRRGPSDFRELNDLALKMGLTSPSRVMLNHPGTRSLIGSIDITGSACDAFEVKMDREGLVETQNFTNLKRIIRMSLDWATVNYEAWLHRARNSKHQEVVKRFEKSFGQSFEDDKSRFKKAIETLESKKYQEELTHNFEKLDETDDQEKKLLTVDYEENSQFGVNLNNTELSASESNEQKDTEQEKLDTAKQYALSKFEALDAEVELLRAVSATAPLLFVFAHEVKGIAHTLLSQSAELKLIADQVGDVSIRNKLNEMAESASLYKKSFDDLFELFDVFSDSASNSNKKISFKNLFSRVETGFSFFTQQFKIKLTFEDVNPTWKVPKLNQAEAYSVLINLLSNSVKSLIASKTTDRKLHVSLLKSDFNYIMVVKDNGIGLSEEHWEKVFEARTYDPENKLYSSLSSQLGDEQLSNLGKGSGLGLNIVRNILRKYKFDASFTSPSEDWQAEVKVILGN